MRTDYTLLHLATNGAQHVFCVVFVIATCGPSFRPANVCSNWQLSHHLMYELSKLLPISAFQVPVFVNWFNRNNHSLFSSEDLARLAIVRNCWAFHKSLVHSVSDKVTNNRLAAHEKSNLAHSQL